MFPLSDINSNEDVADEGRLIGHLPMWHDYVNVKERISSLGPYRFFMTLTFQYEISDSAGKEALAQVWRRITKRVAGRRWVRKGIKPLTGVAVLEKAQLFNHSTREFGSCHFHLLVRDHPSLPQDDLLAAMKLWSAFSSAAMQLTHKNRRWQLVSRHGIDLQRIRSKGVEKLYRYVSKEALRYGWDWSERVFYLSGDGI